MISSSTKQVVSHSLLLLLYFTLSLCVTNVIATNDDEDDFIPRKYSPGSDVELAHQYPHLSTSLQQQDNTFMSNEETKQDYGISLLIFPALIAGICFIFVCFFSCFICCRCFLLGCLNCLKCCCRICRKDCCRKTEMQKDIMLEKRKKWYNIYSKTFPFLLLCSVVAIIWVWVGASHLNSGVEETQGAMGQFGDIVGSISDELDAMSDSGRRIDAFLAFNTCPPTVNSYLEDIEENFAQFTNTTDKAAKITGSIEPVVDKASDKLEEYWDETQEMVFDMSAGVLFVVIGVYALGVCMKTAILMRLGIFLTIILSFVLCILVFIEMVVVMGYSDFCMSPTYHMERSLNGYAYDVVHYYSSCEGEGPLFKPIDDALEYNSVMNSTYFAMLNDNPLLSASCRLGADNLAEAFFDISESAINIVDFSKCPHINRMYTQLVLDGFCSESYSGLYNIHVSHLATLSIFFLLMVNAALLYPHFKGKTLKHLCWCCYSKEHLEAADDRHRRAGDDKVFSVLYHSSQDSDDSDEDIEGGHVHVAAIPTTDPDNLNNVEMIARANPVIEQTIDLSTSFGGDNPNTVFTVVNPSFGGGEQSPSRLSPSGKGRLSPVNSGRFSPSNSQRFSPKNNGHSEGSVVRVKAEMNDEEEFVLGEDDYDVY